MDLTPGEVEITEEMVNVYDDSARAARVVGVRMGLSGWALNRYVIVSALGGLRSHLEYQATEAAYRAGREDAARAVEEFGDPIICHECGPDVVGFAAAARSTSLGRSSQGVGDNPEEQRP